MRAYRQDFEAIATLIAGDGQPVASVRLSEITTESLRTAFAGYADTPRSRLDPGLLVHLERAVHASVHRRAHPGQSDAADRLAQGGQGYAKSVAQQCNYRTAAEPTDRGKPRRRSDWPERDRAIILTALLAGLRSEELNNANIGDLRRTPDGAVIQVRGKGGRTAASPSSQRSSRASRPTWTRGLPRLPATAKRRSPTGGLTAWPPSSPLFVGTDGDRITRGTLQYRVLRAFRKAGIDGARAAAPSCTACGTP